MPPWRTLRKASPNGLAPGAARLTVDVLAALTPIARAFKWLGVRYYVGDAPEEKCRSGSGGTCSAC